MARRRFVRKSSRKKKIHFFLLFACLLVIGLGYANLVSNLGILGSLSLKKALSFSTDPWDVLIGKVRIKFM